MSKSTDNSAAYSNELSRIAQGVVISGDISSRSDIRIDGRMSGKLYSEGRVVLGETSFVNGSIICRDIDLYGTVEGDIYVSNILSIKGTAVVNGNIHVRKIQVEMGAQLNGTCSMIDDETFNTLRSQVVSLPVPEFGSAAETKQEKQEAKSSATKEFFKEVASTFEKSPEDAIHEEAEEEKKSKKSPFRY